MILHFIFAYLFMAAVTAGLVFVTGSSALRATVLGLIWWYLILISPVLGYYWLREQRRKRAAQRGRYVR